MGHKPHPCLQPPPCQQPLPAPGLLARPTPSGGTGMVLAQHLQGPVQHCGAEGSRGL